MSTDEYEAITEAEWKVLATTEITHLTDEEKDYLPRAWDEWIARVRRDAAQAALLGAEQHIRANMDEPYGDRAANRVADYARTYHPEESP